MSATRITLMNMDSPRMLGPGVVRVAAPPSKLSFEEVREQLYRDELDCPHILETRFHRHLLFAHDAVQSSMRLDAPDRLITAYMRKMMAFLLFKPTPHRIVMIGLGGGSLPKFCYRHLPETQITVIEIDARVIALRDEFCIPKDDERFRIVHDDGARYLVQMEDKTDVILVDAFDAFGIAPSLADSDFYAHAASKLVSDGVLIMNICGARGRYAAHFQCIRASFGKHTIIVPVRGHENLLLFAFKKRTSEWIINELEQRAQLLQARLTLNFSRYLRRIIQGQLQM